MLMRRVSMLIAATLVVVMLVACGAPATAPAPTAAPAPLATTAPVPTVTGNPTPSGSLKFLSVQAENEGYTKIVNLLTAEFTAANPRVRYEFEQAPQTDLEQKLQLLASSNSLPLMFPSAATATLIEMYRNGFVLDVEATFTKLGIIDKLNPVALSLVRNLGNGTALGIPMELNIEGFWYNKQIFAEHGIAVPQTWEELLAAAEKLHTAGIQPFAASGEQGWPLTRLIGLYAQRKYGPDALERVAAGELKLTDPGFIEAAQAVQDLGLKGYFGPGVVTIDYATAVDLFVQGRAAMFYMGSWELRTFNDPTRNLIGAENIGFFNFPTVPDGVGSLNDWPMNAGLTVSLGKAAYESNQPLADAWLTYVFERYGDRSMSELGAITGFKVENMPANTPPLTQMVQSQIDAAQTPMLWFEARFDSAATVLSQRNAQLLITGDMSAEEFMRALQAELDN